MKPFGLAFGKPKDRLRGGDSLSPDYGASHLHPGYA
jgi:hypothetical protein